MEWTDNVPGKSGMYWFWEEDSAPVIVSITCSGMDNVVRWFSGRREQRSSVIGQWAGPLTPPPSRHSEGEG